MSARYPACDCSTNDPTPTAAASQPDRPVRTTHTSTRNSTNGKKAAHGFQRKTRKSNPTAWARIAVIAPASTATAGAMRAVTRTTPTAAARLSNAVPRSTPSVPRVAHERCQQPERERARDATNPTGTTGRPTVCARSRRRGCASPRSPGRPAGFQCTPITDSAATTNGTRDERDRDPDHHARHRAVERRRPTGRCRSTPSTLLRPRRVWWSASRSGADHTVERRAVPATRV